VPGPSVGAFLLSRVCRAWLGSGGEVYIRAEGVRESRCYTRGEGRGEMRDAMPVVVINEEKEKTHKTWYITLYNKLFGGKRQK